MKWLKWGLLGIFLSIGLSVEYQSLEALYYVHEASTWPYTEGVIQSVGFSGGGSGTAHAEARIIAYSYSVNGRRFAGGTEYFGIRTATNKQTTGGYMRLQKVNVYYNPDDPSQSVLKPHSKKGVILPLIGGIAFILFSIIGFVVPDRK